jgi:phosphosulfolactate phosphohydrolase-like enzyme
MAGSFEVGRSEDEGGAVLMAGRRRASSMTRREVQIDSLADSVHRHADRAIVCIDVLLSSTSAVTSLAQGRRTVLATTVEEARLRGRSLNEAVLMGEPGLPGVQGPEFCPGPCALESRGEGDVVVVSPAAKLLYDAQCAHAVYVACLRNMSATAELLAERHDRVTLVGAGYGGEVRYEDQMVAAWIAGKLVAHGFEPAGLHTVREIERWSKVEPSVAALGRGAEHLRRLGQGQELHFVLSRVDDLDLACRFQGGELRQVWRSPARSLVSH